MLARLAAFLRSLPDHRLLDRIVRGRAWIPLLGLMLAGIVFMQVEVLKVGASIGRSIQTATALQSRNELLRANVASLADDIRIERTAARMGMVMPAPSTVGFLYGKHGSARQAAANIHAPDATTFLADLASSAAATMSSPTGMATANGLSTNGTVVSSSGVSLAATASPSASGSTVTTPSSVATTPSSTATPSSAATASTITTPTTPTTTPAGTGTTGSSTTPITTGPATSVGGTPSSTGSTGSSSGGAGMTGG